MFEVGDTVLYTPSEADIFVGDTGIKKGIIIEVKIFSEEYRRNAYDQWADIWDAPSAQVVMDKLQDYYMIRWNSGKTTSVAIEYEKKLLTLIQDGNNVLKGML